MVAKHLHRYTDKLQQIEGLALTFITKSSRQLYLTE